MGNWRKKVSYFILGIYFVLEGVEYAVILPTLWMYLQKKFHAESYFFGFVLSVVTLASMITAPVFGRWADVTRRPKIPILIGAALGMFGNFMYFLGISKWVIFSSRALAGAGMGAEAVMFAEVSRATSEEERTSVLSTMIMIRQSGLLLGPGLNVFLRLANFRIGSLVVNKYSSPGAIMTILWFLEILLLLTCYTDLHKLTELDTTENLNLEPGHDNATFAEKSKINVYNSINTNIQDSTTLKDISTGQKSEDVYNTGVKQKLTIRFLYETFIREEVVALLAFIFLGFFCQVSIESMATPLTSKILQWGDLENSIMFCAASFEMILVFLLLNPLSKYLEDRTLILIGVCVLVAANGYLTYVLPKLYEDTPSHNLPKFVVIIILVVLAIPFICVCCISLYSKILPKEIHGLSQGIRTIVTGIAVTIAPLWTGSTLQWPYIMNGVILGLLLVSLLMLLLSYDRLLPPSESRCISLENSSGSDTDVSSVNDIKMFNKMCYKESKRLITQ